MKILLTAACFFLMNLVSAQSLKLWYNQPAIKWTEALPLGNGRIGAMVFGDAAKDRIQFNEETLWSGSPRNYNRPGAYRYLDTIRQLLLAGKQKEADALAEKEFLGLKSDDGQYQADYQPFGDLWLQSNNTTGATNYKRELDISNAIAATSYTANGVDYKREYFISQPQQVMTVHLSASKKNSISFQTSFSSPHEGSTVRKVNDSTIALSVKVKNGVLRGESYLLVKTLHGKLTIEDNTIKVTNADEATLYLAAATSFKNYMDVSADPVALCAAVIKNISGKSYAQIKDAHVKEYQQYFNTFSIDLGKNENEKLPTDERIEKFAATGDPSFVSLYLQYGRYLLIAASRPGTRPANLQGIWNDLLSPPWGSKYTVNINAEMNYWPAELLNLSALHQPLFGMIEELAVTGKQTAKEYYNAPGWVLHHNTDLWRGTAAINAANHGIWVTGGAWLCHHLWEHYLFTQDAFFLRNKAYPLMKEAALFFNNFLIKDPVTGYLISGPSNSPEQGGLVMGPTMDHEIIRDLFKNTIAAGKLLGVDQPLLDTLSDKYKKIAPQKIGKYGQLQEWMQDVDDTSNKHRHVSHLWAQFPGNEINWDETPELMKAARQSLLYRGDAATGWSLGWKINLWARFKDGNHTYKLIQMLMSPARTGAGSYPNLFDAHPPFQIDGNFGGAAGIGEMLLQSQTKYIDLLPALPAALPNGNVKGICARGGFVLNIKWNNAKLQRLEIISNAGEIAMLRYAGKELKLVTQKGKSYVLDGNLQLIK